MKPRANKWQPCSWNSEIALQSWYMWDASRATRERSPSVTLLRHADTSFSLCAHLTLHRYLQPHLVTCHIPIHHFGHVLSSGKKERHVLFSLVFFFMQMLLSVCIMSKQAISLAPAVEEAWFERKLLKTCMHLAGYKILRTPEKKIKW